MISDELQSTKSLNSCSLSMNRIAISWLAFLLLASGCGEETSTDPVARATKQVAPPLIDGEYSAVITIVNYGMSAWLISDIEGSNASASINTQNARLSLNTGSRYKFINAGGVNHPLDFRDSGGDYLLTQDTISGKYEEDVAVDYAFNYGEGSVAFTITDQLAAELASYNCTFHVPMTGDLSVN